MDGTVSRHGILSLSVIGGFLDGLELAFGPGLNTIIGARGTGKTTAIEFIGYALDCLPSREHAADERKRIETLVKRNLDGGRIHVGIQAADGIHYTVTRSFGDERFVLDAEGEPVSVNLKSGLFRADIFSQNAVESIADRPLFQLDLIDSFAGKSIADIFSREQQLVSTLKLNAHQIIPLEREAAAITDDLVALPGIETRLKAYTGGGNSASAEINEAHRLKACGIVRPAPYASSPNWSPSARNHSVNKRASWRPDRGISSTRKCSRDRTETSWEPFSSIRQRVPNPFDDQISQAVQRMERAGEVIAEQAEAIAQRQREQELIFRATIEKHKQARQQAAERTELERRRNQLLARGQQRTELGHQITELYARRGERIRCRICLTRSATSSAPASSGG